MSTRRPRLRPRSPPRRDEEWDGEEERTGKFKSCCRSVATFMCTQVGVGGIIVGYAIVGAFGFMALETQEGSVCDAMLEKVLKFREDTAEQLYKDYEMNAFNETGWEWAANRTLWKFQEQVVIGVKNGGYDGRTVVEQWNFPAALMFTLSIFTMIGYGNLVPRTQWGKVITISYAVFGIPLYVLYFMNMGRALARTFKWLYIKLNSCSVGSGTAEEMREEEVLVPSSASVYVLLSYIGVGTVMFAEWEEWEYLDAAYFCVTSLCKIGLGDFVPGTNIEDTKAGNQTKLVINFVYLLLGLGLVAMCYNLLREEVLAKLKQLKSDLKDICQFVRNDCSCTT